MKFNFDYSKTLMMKMGVGVPDNKGGCKIINTFEEILEKVKIVDNLTLGIPKIIYLVGWQYNGHDDRYPAFFEVNKSAARKEDSNARESFIWLFNEAKKYNTTISVHINLTDAYIDSPLWDEYIEKDLILKNNFGKLKKTGTWNGRSSYQVRYQKEYESGYFKKRVDKLFDLLPLEEMGTVHVDAFFVRNGKDTRIKDEKLYRLKMIEYFRSRGVDITSEFIYREMNCGPRVHFGKSDVIGYIPAIWNLVLSQKDYLNYFPDVVAGGELNMDLQKDKKLEFLFYGNPHGEGSFGKKEGWKKSFIKEFSLKGVPYFFITNHKLIDITGHFDNRTAEFSDGIKTKIKNKQVLQNNKILKENETLLIPIFWQNETYYTYSSEKCSKIFDFPNGLVTVYKITADGCEKFAKKEIKNGKIELSFDGIHAQKIVKEK